MAIEGKPLEDFRASPGPIPGLPEIGNETAPRHHQHRRLGCPAGCRARGLLSAPESSSGYWLGLSDAITVTGLSR